MRAKKILVVRFSSIGDIILTTPVLRSIKSARPDWELHYFTKAAYQDLLRHNPYVDQLHLLQSPLSKQIQDLRAENFDHIIDLHHNLRTLRIKWGLRIPSSSFSKHNLAKYMMVRLKRTSPAIPHVVDRYGGTLKDVGLSLDGGGLDFFLPEGMEEWAKQCLLEAGVSSEQGDTLAVVLGATFRTKRWLTNHFIQTLQGLSRSVLLLGGKDARKEADQLIGALSVPLMDAVGKFGILQSAALMKQCSEVLTHDTGLMHIAAAWGMDIYSIWGSTVPEFGMRPYQSPHRLIENTDLNCRPCSKIGFDRCPKGHFRCMEEIHPERVIAAIQEGLS